MIEKINHLLKIRKNLCYRSFLDIRRSEALEEFATLELERLINTIDAILINQANAMQKQCLIYFTSYRELIRMTRFQYSISDINFAEMPIYI